MSDITDRLDALEKKLAGLTVGDLPLAALQRRLEQNWQPDASVLLQPGSITPELLAGAAPTLISGTVKLSPKRTLSAVTMPVGVNVVAADLTGLTAAGILVASIVPSAHNTWSWYPHLTLGGIVFNNSGAAQTVAVNYYVIGT